MESVGHSAVELLTELVSIDSVNAGLVPGASGEADIVAWLDQRLQSSGFETHVIAPADQPERPSLLALPPGPPEWPTIALNGHVDTVGVAGMDAPFTARIEGDRLFARGAADMKGGVAGIVAAAEALVASGAPVRPILALVADEEDASVGSAAVIDTLRDSGVTPDACLIAEPTGLDIAQSLRGFGIVTVTFPGKAGHSSQPDLAINAVTHLGRFLQAVDERAETIRQDGGDFMVTSVRGGLSTFVIPDSAECVVEMRTTPTQQGSQALVEVESLLEQEWNATAHLELTRDGWRLDSKGTAADFAALLGDALGTGPTFAAPYWMEAPMWQRLCPTLICGPTGGGLHAIDEWVDLNQVRRFATSLTDAVNTWASTR